MALGIDGLAVDGLVKLASTGTSLHSDGNAMRDRVSTQYELAKAKRCSNLTRRLIEAAREWLTQETVELPERASLHRAQVHAGETAVDIADRLYRPAGTAPLKHGE